MPNPTNTVRQQLIDSLKNQTYRRAFVDAGVQADIAAQIRVNRTRRGMKQRHLAKIMGKPQGTISKLEDPEKEGISVNTLKEIAAAFDVALLIRFVSFSSLLEWLGHPSEDKLFAESFQKDRGLVPDRSTVAVFGTTVTTATPQAKDISNMIIEGVVTSGVSNTSQDDARKPETSASSFDYSRYLTHVSHTGEANEEVC